MERAFNASAPPRVISLAGSWDLCSIYVIANSNDRVAKHGSGRIACVAVFVMTFNGGLLFACCQYDATWDRINPNGYHWHQICRWNNVNAAYHYLSIYLYIWIWKYTHAYLHAVAGFIYINASLSTFY